MSSAKPIRWGILGTGWVAQRFMADLSGVAGAELAAVASRSDTRVQTMADRYGVRHAHVGYESLIRDDGVDVVYVATEPHEHVTHCLSALRAGKHVLCEKPFAISLEQAEQIAHAARVNDRFCMEAMWSRFLPGTIEAKRCIDAGAIGFASVFAADFGTPVSEETTRFFDLARGGGALLDRGVYALSLAMLLFGKPTAVSAKAIMHESGADRSVVAILGFADNRMATVSASLSVYSTNQAVISGSAGRIVLHEPFFRPDRVTITRAPAPTGATKSELLPDSPRERLRRLASRVKPYIPHGARRSKELRFPVTGYGYGYEAAEVVRCINEGLRESPMMPLRDSLAVMDVVDQIRAQIVG